MTALSGKSCVITGAGSGVGRQAALLFAENGARVVCADIEAGSAQATAEAVRAKGGEAHSLHCDVRKADEVGAAVAMAVARFGRLDVMYNNAGVGSGAVGPGKAFQDYTEDDLALLTGINFFGVAYGCQAATRQFLAQGDGGVIVNTGSVAGMVGWGGAVYGATKGAVNQLTRSLAIELAPHRIRVNAICPAGMITNFGLAPGAAPRAPATAEQLESYGKLHPLGSVIEPIDAAEAALFLASSRSKNITGVLLPVDGGYTAA